MNPYSEVLFEEMSGTHGDLGIITLNRPQALNSLSHDMIVAMHNQLKDWESASHIKAVVIKATEGRAFCAGGDLRLLYDRNLTQDPRITEFFYEEYHLNRYIFHYPKPYIALLNGITMGGGVGVSIHGSHRVATENLLFAMPETGIGFYPDVGGTYFLPRIKNHLGYYLGLTGTRIASDECVFLGITQQKVASTSLGALVEAIANKNFGADAHASVTQVIEEFKQPISETALSSDQAILASCFSGQTMHEIMHALTQSDHEICQKAHHELLKKSPTSLKVTLKAMQVGATMEFDTCMRQEYRLTCHFLEGHDFIEGIRALIVDKDQKPVWKPAKLDEVSEANVETYFAPLTKELV